MIFPFSFWEVVECFSALDCFKDSMKILEEIFLWVYVFISYMYLKVRILRYKVRISFLRHCQTFFKGACLILYSHKQIMRSSSFKSSSKLDSVRILNLYHSSECMMISHCHFNLYCSNDRWSWTSLNFFLDYLYGLLCEVFAQVLCIF